MREAAGQSSDLGPANARHVGTYRRPPEPGRNRL